MTSGGSGGKKGAKDVVGESVKALEDMNVDEFMDGFGEEEDDGDDDDGDDADDDDEQDEVSIEDEGDEEEEDEENEDEVYAPK
jgi:hypothetical protein